MKNHPFEKLVILAVVIVLSACSPDKEAKPELVRIAAASNLKFALDELLGELEAQGAGLDVDVTYGSSGNLRAQIENGAPFDLFLSADMRFVEVLIEAGHADAKDQFLYAIGELVIWAPSGSEIDLKSDHQSALLAPSIKKIAIANPQHSPYGQAAVAALRSFGIYEEVGPKLVYGENISQAAQFVDSGSTDLGMIALSLALAPTMRDRGHYWKIPQAAYPVLLQGGVIVRSTKHREKAESLKALLLSESGMATLAHYGFLPPDSNPLEEGDATD